MVWSYLVLISQLDHIECVCCPVPGEPADHCPLVPVIQELPLQYHQIYNCFRENFIPFVLPRRTC